MMLKTIFGTMKDEKLIHLRFKSYRVSAREIFVYGGELKEFIDNLQSDAL